MSQLKIGTPSTTTNGLRSRCKEPTPLIRITGAIKLKFVDLHQQLFLPIVIQNLEARLAMAFPLGNRACYIFFLLGSKTHNYLFQCLRVLLNVTVVELAFSS
jgi:hypothetical protein